MDEFDALLFDIEFGSSPSIDFDESTIKQTIPSPKRSADLPDFDFPSIPTISFDNLGISIAPEKIKINKRAQTPKKRSLIFHPFATFESTELTVNQLKLRLGAKSAPRSLSI